MKNIQDHRLFSAQDCNREYHSDRLEAPNNPSGSEVLNLHQHAFFAYNDQATIEDWNSFVDADPDLVEARKNSLDEGL